jgi:hypothetical protein
MKTNLHEDYKALARALDDEELVENYLEREGYEEEYVAVLAEELAARGLSPDTLAPGDTATSILMKKKSDQELRAIYLDMEGTPEKTRKLAVAEATRRGLPVDTSEEAREEFLARQGQRGKHVFAGYIFSVLGGLIGLIIALDYVLSTRQLGDETVYKYDSTTRKDGKSMLVVLAIVVTLFTLVKVYG